MKPFKGRLARALILMGVVCAALTVYWVSYVHTCHVSWASGTGRIVRRYHWKWEIFLYTPAAKFEAAVNGLEVWVGPRDSNSGGRWHEPFGIPRRPASITLTYPPDAPPGSLQRI